MSASKANEEELTDVIKQQAERCAQALIEGKYEEFLGFNHERLVKLMGGKEAMINTLKKGTKEMAADDAGLESAELGMPTEPQKMEGWLVSTVVQKLTMKVKGGKLRTKSTMIAISEDGGKKWVFLDAGKYHDPEFAKLFPELAGKLTIPARTKPIFTADP